MLKTFSRLEKTRNFVILIFAAIMVLSLVLFYAPTRNQVIENKTRSTETAAQIGGETITLGELSMQKERQERQQQMFGMQGSVPSSRVVESAVAQKIIKQEAAKRGFVTSDDELRAKLIEQNKDEEGNQIDQKQYEQFAMDSAGSIKKYEDSVRDSIAATKLEAFLTNGVTVSEDEVLNDFKKRQTKFDLNFVTVYPSELASTIKPTDAELQKYFEDNKKTYFISTAQKKIRYVFVNQAKVGEKLAITDEEIKAEYDALPIDRKQAGVQVQQIVLRVPKPELDAQVLAKASALVTEMRGTEGKITEETFAEKAKGQSEDAKTAQLGGKIAGLVKANPNNPTDPLQKTLTMQPGEITEPTKFGSSYYIFRRGDPVAKPIEDAKKEIEVSLRNRRSYVAAADLAQKVAAKLKEVKDVQKVAEEFASQANMSSKDMVRETGFVKKDDDVPNIGVSPQFESGIEALENANDTGDKIPVKDGFAIPLLVEKKEPRDAEFAEVKDKVSEALKSQQAVTKVEEVAKAIAGNATTPASLASAASGKGLKAEDSKGFSLGGALGKSQSAGTSKELEDAIAGLKVGEITKTPIKVGEGYYIVGVSNRIEAKMEEFTKQRDQMLQQSLFQKRGQVFEDYLAEIRNKMEAAGQIKIYKEVTDKLDEVAEDAAPGMPAGLPQMPQGMPQGLPQGLPQSQ
jgi:peptidyl-prolyl cis-trans isomerase D